MIVPGGARSMQWIAFGRAARLVAVPAFVVAVDCRAPGDLGGLGSDDAACIPPSPCPALTYVCAAGSARAYRVADAAGRPLGARALASVGDYVLENEHLTVVIDAIDHPHHLAA